MNHKQINRRSMLKGIAGASMALPFLDVMAENAPKGSDESKPPLRFGALFHPNGVYPKHWDVTGKGKDYKTSKCLSPLEAVRDDVSILSNIDNTSQDGGHVRAVMSFLTGVTLKKGKPSKCGISMDQLLAKKIGQNTRLASLELGTEPPRGGGNAGAPIAFASSVSWSSPTTKVPVEINPRVVFDRMFGNSAVAKERSQENLLLVDRVQDQAKAMRKAVGQADRNKVDEYLESVYAVETRINNALNPRSSNWKPVTKPRLIPPKMEIPKSRPEHFKMMLDLMVLALQTDSTRVCTFMTGHGFSRKSYSFLDGVNADHHTVSHHKESKNLVDQYSLVTKWHIEQFTYLLQKMKNIDEGGSSLLDNCMMLYGGSLKNGNGHDIKNLPMLLAGKGGGLLNPGRHVICPKGTLISDLHLTLLNKMGLEMDHFATSKRTLAML